MSGSRVAGRRYIINKMIIEDSSKGRKPKGGIAIDDEKRFDRYKYYV